MGTIFLHADTQHPYFENEVGVFLKSVGCSIKVGAAAVFKRGEAVALLEDGGEFPLVAVADLGGNVGDGIGCVDKEGCGFFYALLAQVARDVLAVNAAKIIFQAGFASAEFSGNVANWHFIAQVSCEECGSALCEENLCFCIEAAGFRSGRFGIKQQVKERENVQAQTKKIGLL